METYTLLNHTELAEAAESCLRELAEVKGHV